MKSWELWLHSFLRMGPKWKYHLRLIHLYLAQLINTYLPICLILHNNTTMRNNNYFVRINRFTCFFFTLETNQDTFFCDLTNYPRYLFWYATASRNSGYDRMLHIWFWVANRNNRLFRKNIRHPNLILTECQINPWTSMDN